MRCLNRLKTGSATPIRELVYTELRKAILSGEIPTGTRLAEAQLASEIGASRTPVREALHKLELENLVSSAPRVGYFVSGLTEEDILDLCEIRSAIEGLAAKRAIAQIMERHLERLRRNIEQSRETIRKGTLEKMVALDTEFHDILCQSSGSRRIQELSQALRGYMHKFRKECLRFDEIASRAVEGHEKIYRAICERDVPMAQKYIADHLGDVQKDVMNYYKSTGKSHE